VGKKIAPLPGFRAAKPTVFQGLFPQSGDEFEALRAAVERLVLNDASVSVSNETSVALGPGYEARGCSFARRVFFFFFLIRRLARRSLARSLENSVALVNPSIGPRDVLGVSNRAHMRTFVKDSLTTTASGPWSRSDSTFHTVATNQIIGSGEDGRLSFFDALDPDANMILPYPSRARRFRCGFLGLLHADVFHQRLREEFDADVVATAPTVSYRVRYPDTP
jgi:hypothetical protein